MDISKYIESEPIANFLKNNKNLSILNYAELISENLSLSIEEKNKIYKQLIDTMEDIPLTPQLDYNFSSAKQFLNTLIEEQSKLLDILGSKQYEFFVTYHYFENKNSKTTKRTETYKSFEYEILIAEETSKQYENLDFIVLYSKQLNFRGLVNKNGQLVKVDYPQTNCLLDFFESNHYICNLPFKKGDILYNFSMEVADPRPFVLQKIEWDKGGLCYYGYALDENLYHQHIIEFDVWHLDYYTAEDDNVEYQYLKALSLFARHKISELELLKIRDFAILKQKQDELIAMLDFNDNTRDILYNLMG